MCDLLVALGSATDTGTTLFAKNSDRPPDEPQRLEWHPSRHEERTRTTYMEIPGRLHPTVGFLGSRPDWMWGIEHGVNEAGVAAGNATIYTTLDPRGRPDGLTGMDLVRLALERSDSAAGAVALVTDLIEQHGQGGSGHRQADRPYWSSFVFADPASAWVVETSGREWETESVVATRCTSNRTTIAGFDAVHRHPGQPVDRLVDPRLSAGRAVLAKRPVTAGRLRAHLRSHEGGTDGWTVCMHVDGVEATTAALVAELTAQGPPVCWVLAGSPCRSVFVPVVLDEALGEVPSWERFTSLDDVSRVRLDELEAEVASLVNAPPHTSNVERWSFVARSLSDLGH